MADANPEDFKAPTQGDMDNLVLKMQSEGLSRSQSVSMMESITSGALGESKGFKNTMSLFNKSWAEEPTPVALPATEVDKSFAVDFEQEEVGLGFIGDDALTVTRSEASNTEFAALASATIGADKSLAKDQLQNGDDAILEEMYAKVQADLDQFIFEKVNKQVVDAQTPEDVVGILERFNAEGKTLVNLSTLRSYALSKMENMQPERMGYVSQRVARNILLSQEIQKRSNELSAATPLLSLLGDFSEYFSPTGTASEQIMKYKNSIPEALDVISSAPADKQVEILNAFLDGWEQQETLLIENNNSLMTLSQFETLRRAVLQGGLDVIDGKTDAEVQQFAESGLDALLALSGTTGIFKGTKGLFGVLSKKLFASDEVEVDPKLVAQLFDPSIASPNTIRVAPTTRTGSHTVDTEYVELPVNKLKAEQEGGLEKIVADTGLTKEQVASRQVFTPVDETELAFANALDNITSMNELILVDKSLTNLGMTRARDLERQAGTSLTTIHSATGFKANDIEDSLGTFTFLMGDGAKGGFDNLDEATNAMRVGLAGFDAKVVQKDGKWFAEATLVHKFDPTKDVEGLYLDPTFATGALGRAFLNPLRILGEDVIKGLYALKGKNRSIVQKFEEEFRDLVKPLSANSGLRLTQALKKGDDEGIEWTTEVDFVKATGFKDPAVYTAYRAIREMYDNVFELRNKVYYQKLSSANLKYVDDGADGNLGKVLDPKKDIDSADGLVWDVETKKLIKPTPDDGYNYIKLSNALDAGEKVGKRTIIRVKPERVSRLPEKVLNKRDGHIDRFYRETGWIVQKVTKETVDGKEIDKVNVTHIVATRKDAERIAEQDGGRAVRSRENDDLDGIFGSDSDVQFSYGGSHTKKRGEQLKGSDGLNAPILDAFESVGKSITSTQSALDYNMLKSVEARFYNEFDDMLAQGRATPFSTDAKSMLKRGVNTTSNREQDFKNWHSYIKTLRTHTNGQAYKAIDEATSFFFDPILKIAGRGTDSQAAVQSLKGLVSNLFVVLNPFYQVPQNTVIGTYIATTKGSSGFKAALQLPALIAARKTGNYTALAKLIGGDEALARELVKEMDSNGLIDAVGRSNDFLDMARGRLDVGATTRIAKAGQIASMPFKGVHGLSRTGQEKAIAAMNSLSYLAEFNDVMKAGGKFNGKGKAEISFRAQKNVQTQNSLDMFKYQDNSSLLSVPLQFFQHVNKLFLDIIVEPQYKVITGAVETVLRKEFKRNGKLGKEAGPYAKTYAQALTTTMLTYSLFGMQGGLAQSLGSNMEATFRESFPELADVPIFEIMMNGVINEAFNSTVESLGGKGAIDITSTYGPAAFIDMVSSFMLEGFPSFNVLGVSGAAVGTIFESANAMQAIARAPNIDTLEKALFMAHELMEPISGLKNIEKAAIGYTFQELPFARSLTSGLKIEGMEAVMLAANIQPALVTDYFAKSSFDAKGPNMLNIFSSKARTERNASTMLQAMTRDMFYHKAQGTLDLQKSFDLLEKWSSNAKAVSNPKHGDIVSLAFARNALTSGSATYDTYLKPYLQGAQQNNRAEGLRILAQKAQSPEAKAVFESALAQYEKQDSLRNIIEGTE